MEFLVKLHLKLKSKIFMKKIFFFLFSITLNFAFGQTVETPVKPVENNIDNTPNISVRNNSISSITDAEPLFVVIDGKIMEGLTDENLASSINPDDIERIDVLKHEKAIAEYGEKGKYGVIKITMKKKK